MPDQAAKRELDLFFLKPEDAKNCFRLRLFIEFLNPLLKRRPNLGNKPSFRALGINFNFLTALTSRQNSVYAGNNNL